MQFEGECLVGVEILTVAFILFDRSEWLIIANQIIWGGGWLTFGWWMDSASLELNVNKVQSLLILSSHVPCEATLIEDR